MSCLCDTALPPTCLSGIHDDGMLLLPRRPRGEGSLRRRLLNARVHQYAHATVPANHSAAWGPDQKVKTPQPHPFQKNQEVLLQAPPPQLKYKRSPRRQWFKRKKREATPTTPLLLGGDSDRKWSAHYTTQKPLHGLLFLPSTRRGSEETVLHYGSAPVASGSRMHQSERSRGFEWQQRSRKLRCRLSDCLSQSCCAVLWNHQSSLDSDDDEQLVVGSTRPMTPLVLTSCWDGPASCEEGGTSCSEGRTSGGLPTPEEVTWRHAQSVMADIVAIDITGQCFERQAVSRSLSQRDLQRPDLKWTGPGLVQDHSRDPVSTDLVQSSNMVQSSDMVQSSNLVQFSERTVTRRIRAPRGALTSLMDALTSSTSSTSRGYCPSPPHTQGDRDSLCSSFDSWSSLSLSPSCSLQSAQSCELHTSSVLENPDLLYSFSNHHHSQSSLDYEEISPCFCQTASPLNAHPTDSSLPSEASSDVSLTVEQPCPETGDQREVLSSLSYASLCSDRSFSSFSISSSVSSTSRTISLRKSKRPPAPPVREESLRRKAKPPRASLQRKREEEERSREEEQSSRGEQRSSAEVNQRRRAKPPRLSLQRRREEEGRREEADFGDPWVPRRKRRQSGVICGSTTTFDPKDTSTPVMICEPLVSPSSGYYSLSPPTSPSFPLKEPVPPTPPPLPNNPSPLRSQSRPRSRLGSRPGSGPKPTPPKRTTSLSIKQLPAPPPPPPLPVSTVATYVNTQKAAILSPLPNSPNRIRDAPPKAANDRTPLSADYSPLPPPPILPLPPPPPPSALTLPPPPPLPVSSPIHNTPKNYPLNPNKPLPDHFTPRFKMAVRAPPPKMPPKMPAEASSPFVTTQDLKNVKLRSVKRQDFTRTNSLPEMNTTETKCDKGDNGELEQQKATSTSIINETSLSHRNQSLSEEELEEEEAKELEEQEKVLVEEKELEEVCDETATSSLFQEQSRDLESLQFQIYESRFSQGTGGHQGSPNDTITETNLSSDLTPADSESPDLDDGPEVWDQGSPNPTSEDINSKDPVAQQSDEDSVKDPEVQVFSSNAAGEMDGLELELCKTKKEAETEAEIVNILRDLDETIDESTEDVWTDEGPAEDLVLLEETPLAAEVRGSKVREQKAQIFNLKPYKLQTTEMFFRSQDQGPDQKILFRDRNQKYLDMYAVLADSTAPPLDLKTNLKTKLKMELREVEEEWEEAPYWSLCREKPVQQQEVQPQKVQQQEVQPQKVQLQEVQPQEVQPQEVQLQEVQLQEVQLQEVQLQEMQLQEVHQSEGSETKKLIRVKPALPKKPELGILRLLNRRPQNTPEKLPMISKTRADMATHTGEAEVRAHVSTADANFSVHVSTAEAIISAQTGQSWKCENAPNSWMENLEDLSSRGRLATCNSVWRRREAGLQYEEHEPSGRSFSGHEPSGRSFTETAVLKWGLVEEQRIMGVREEEEDVWSRREEGVRRTILKPPRTKCLRPNTSESTGMSEDQIDLPLSGAVSSQSLKGGLLIQEPGDNVFDKLSSDQISDQIHRDTDELFRMIHRSKRKMFGRKDVSCSSLFQRLQNSCHFVSSNSGLF